MKNKSVQNCRFVHHAKNHCIVITLIRPFKIEFERGGGGGRTEKEPIQYLVICETFHFNFHIRNVFRKKNVGKKGCFSEKEI